MLAASLLLTAQKGGTEVGFSVFPGSFLIAASAYSSFYLKFV